MTVVCLYVAHGRPEVCEHCACDKVLPQVVRCVDCGRDRVRWAGRCARCYRTWLQETREDLQALELDRVGAHK